MTDFSVARQKYDGERRGFGPLRWTLLIVAVLIVAFVFATQVYTDWLWFSQLGFGRVFVTETLIKTGVFTATVLLVAVPLWLSMSYAIRHAQVQTPAPATGPGREPENADGDESDTAAEDTKATQRKKARQETEQMLREVFGQESFDRSMAKYRHRVERIRRVILVLLPAVMGIFIASASVNYWTTVALFFNREDFGITDPEFGLDVGFFVFTLPFLTLLVKLFSIVLILAALGGVVMHYFYGGIQVRPGGVGTSKPFRYHMAVLLFLFLLVRGAGLWFDRYTAVQQQSGRWAGAMYTDTNAIIPVKAILTFSAVLVAVLFLVAASTNRWRLPIISTAMLVVVALVAGGLYPWVVQRFQVVPNEQVAQNEFIQRNIDATRYAYGLDKIETTPYDATINTAAGGLANSSPTIENIRLLDPNVVNPAFAQMQQFRPYYRFDPALSVDRYSVDNKTQDTVIAARELNPAQTSGDSWYNQHVVYTHGYGVIAAYGNQVDPANGNPKFMQSGIQATGVLSETYEPRIYFGMSSPQYSIVGGSGDQLELDRPQDEKNDAKYTYNGNGGPRVDSFLNRLSYAIKFQSSDVLLSDAVRDGSQILYERNPLDRVRKAAPYLKVDSKAYPAIINNRVVWVVDGYTTSNQFPYSQGSAQEGASGGRNSTNYIRNSVKATVDAYDGSVNLYAWDEQDPILKAWQKVFPNTIKSYQQMSAELMSHVRYPNDMFTIQRDMLNKYHVTNANSLYAGDDVWSVPNDPTNDSGNSIPPYYLSLQMPGDKQAHFSLTSSFIPQQSDKNSRNVMYGFLSANGDAGTGKDGERNPDYGKLRLLELPRSSAVPGPGQAQSMFNSNPEVQNQLNLLRRGSSEVISGNMLTLPVAGGILYVQPVYVQSGGDTQYPRLQRVLVSFGDKVGFAPSLEEALNQVFGGLSGARIDNPTGSNAAPGEAGSSQQNGSNGSTSQTQDPTLKQALADASKAMSDADAAMKRGDWAAYGEAQKRLNEALQKAIEIEGKQGGDKQGTASTPTPSASATPSSSSSPNTPGTAAPAGEKSGGKGSN